MGERRETRENVNVKFHTTLNTQNCEPGLSTSGKLFVLVVLKICNSSLYVVASDRKTISLLKSFAAVFF